jgi:hypothetical protein
MAEITCGQQVWLDTFETPHEAAHAFDAAAWRFGRQRKDMRRRAETEMLAPEVRLYRGRRCSVAAPCGILLPPKSLRG